ncbi:L-aspartate oxidase [Psychromicrobium lacuslunae]|uniref:L-aspartate oxidase n=1 Tax=Psychromicrobium lacuslunae TaxID=1618207 RepID=UPI0005D2D731|nr:L-aspartate oxidase [Psychromicrobium lacuslunae]
MKTPQRVVVVGSGLAGLTSVLHLVAAAAPLEIQLITKAELGESNSRYAQGGISAVLPEGATEISPELGLARRSPGDSIAAHIQDTMIAGAQINDLAAVRQICESAAGVIADLVNHGVGFDTVQDESGEHWALGLEAAHSYPRILHSGGDSTGAGIIDALKIAVRALAEDRRLVLRENTELVELITEKGKVTGLSIIEPGGEQREISADAVILATGGGGQLYAQSTNPAGATADGLAIAWRAGAVVKDLEYYQFHPTLLVHDEPFMISEAVRGEGAVLCNERGERFMTAQHPNAELAPRDVVSRGIAQELARGGQVFLDVRGVAAQQGEGFLARRFPGIAAALAARGYDWETELLPVTPGAHYWMGGVATDLLGRTSLPGLFAAGELACTGVHGANRLASNSLLEAAVFAAQAVNEILHGDSAWPVFEAESLELPTGHQPMEVAQLRALMMSNAGVVRDAANLEVAAKQLAQWSASDSQSSRLLTAARLLVAAALRHEGSLGAHWRSDFSEQPGASSRSFVNASAELD